VTELLGQGEALTRTQLAELSSLPLSTVSSAVKRLLIRGLLQEEPLPDEPAGAKRRGRPATVLRLPEPQGIVGVVAVTHRVARAALITTAGHIFTRIEEPFDLLDCADIVADCQRLLSAASATLKGAPQIEHVVLALPVPYRQGMGLASLEPPPDTLPAFLAERPQLPQLGWLSTDLAEALERAFGVPAIVDNDCNLAVLGEHAFGSGRGHEHAIYLKLVTGMGAGLVINGQLLRGASGLAGELSHLHVNPEGPTCACGTRGCLGMIATADHILESHRTDFGSTVGLYEVIALAAQGDPAVRNILKALGQLLGRHLAPACLMLNPELIMVDGTLGPAAAPLIEGMQEELSLALPTGTWNAMTLTLGRLGDAAELLGAARLASTQLSAQARLTGTS
jgi:predicted NBD/HSP70 family sugar kinase